MAIEVKYDMVDNIAANQANIISEHLTSMAIDTLFDRVTYTGGAAREMDTFEDFCIHACYNVPNWLSKDMCVALLHDRLLEVWEGIHEDDE